MKNNLLISVTLLLLFSQASFGDDNSQIINFHDYINSSDNSVKNPVDKNAGTVKAADNPTGENQDQDGSKGALKGVPSKWKTCAKDSDCTAAVADCETWEPVNKEYLKNVSKNLNACLESIDPGFQPQTICEDKVCKITEKNTDVSWEEWLNKMR